MFLLENISLIDILSQVILLNFPPILSPTPDGFEKLPNLNPDILKQIEQDLGLKSYEGKTENFTNEFSRRTCWIISIQFYTPSYRETFKIFEELILKIPFDVSADTFGRW